MTPLELFTQAVNDLAAHVVAGRVTRDDARHALVSLYSALDLGSLDWQESGEILSEAINGII